MNVGELLATLGLDISGFSASLAKATADYGQVATAGEQAAQKINRAWSETSVTMRAAVAEAFAEAMRASFQSVVAESESSAQRVQQAWKAIPKVDPITGPGLSQSSADSARAVYSEIANVVEQSARRIQLAVSDIDVTTGQRIVPPLSMVASARAVYSGIASAVEDAAYRIQRAQSLMLPTVDPVTGATRPTSLLPLLSETTAAGLNVSPSRLQTGAAPGAKAAATEVAGQLLTVPLATGDLKAWENQVNSGTAATQRLAGATGQMNDRFNGARMGAFSMGMSIMFGLAPALGHGAAQTVGATVMAQSLGLAWMGIIGTVTALAGVIGTYVVSLERVTKAQAEANVAIRGAQFGVLAQQAQQASAEIEQLNILMERQGSRNALANAFTGLLIIQRRLGESIGGEQPEEKLRRVQEAAASLGRLPFAESVEKSAAATDRARAAASAFTLQLSLEREAMIDASFDLAQYIKDLESAKEHELTAAFAARLNALRLAKSRGTESVEAPVINELYRNRVRELEQTFDTERLRARHQFAQAETHIEIGNIEERRKAFEVAETQKERIITAAVQSHTVSEHEGLTQEITMLAARYTKVKEFYDEEIRIAERATNRNAGLIRQLRETQTSSLDQIATKHEQTNLKMNEADRRRAFEQAGRLIQANRQQQDAEAAAREVALLSLGSVDDAVQAGTNRKLQALFAETAERRRQLDEQVRLFQVDETTATTIRASIDAEATAKEKEFQLQESEQLREKARQRLELMIRAVDTERQIRLGTIAEALDAEGRYADAQATNVQRQLAAVESERARRLRDLQETTLKEGLNEQQAAAQRVLIQREASTKVLEIRTKEMSTLRAFLQSGAQAEASLFGARGPNLLRGLAALEQSGREVGQFSETIRALLRAGAISDDDALRARRQGAEALGPVLQARAAPFANEPTVTRGFDALIGRLKTGGVDAASGFTVFAERLAAVQDGLERLATAIDASGVVVDTLSERFESATTRVQTLGAALRDALAGSAREADAQLGSLTQTVQALGLSSAQTTQLLAALAGAKFAAVSAGQSTVQSNLPPSQATSAAANPVPLPLPDFQREEIMP